MGPGGRGVCALLKVDDVRVIEVRDHAQRLPLPPGLLRPPRLVGRSAEWQQLERAWDQATAFGLRDLLPRVTPYAGNLTRWFVSEVGSVGFLLLQFLMTVVIAGILYAGGEAAADQVLTWPEGNAWLTRRLAAPLTMSAMRWPAPGPMPKPWPL